MYLHLLILLFTTLDFIQTKTLYTCVEVEAPVCRNLDKDGYLHASFPNFVNETSQRQAKHTLNSFRELIGSRCSKELPIFLCSVYLPICKPGLDLRIPPCRELCEISRSQCEPLIIKYSNNTWPDSLNCNQYPSKKDGQLCISPPESNTNGKEVVQPKRKADHVTLHRHETVQLSCPPHQKIHIRKVRHHPHGQHCCPSISLAMLSKRCNNRHICRLKINKKFFGRKCRQNTMHLKFRCVPKQFPVPTNMKVKECDQKVIPYKSKQ